MVRGADGSVTKMSPRMEGGPGQRLAEVWAYLSREEAVELWDALNAWSTEPESRAWRCRVSDSAGNALTITVGDPDYPSSRRGAR
jgi:hypothetical protein